MIKKECLICQNLVDIEKNQKFDIFHCPACGKYLVPYSFSAKKERYEKIKNNKEFEKALKLKANGKYAINLLNFYLNYFGKRNYVVYKFKPPLTLD